jgi:hypothetical protein
VEDTTAARAGAAALPRLARVLAERDVRATFAFVGHLFHASCGPFHGVPHPELPRPRYPWYDRDWYADDPATDETRDPLWYGRSAALDVHALGHDVGAHGYSHAILDPACVDRAFAMAELAAACRAAEDAGLPALRSFVFPQNVIGHEDALAGTGFRCYRATDGDGPARAGPPGGMRRARNLLEHALAATPHTGRPRVRDDGVVVVPSSMPFLGRAGVRRAVARSARTARIEKGLERAAREQAVLHLWTHPHQFAGEDSFDDLLAVLERVDAWRDRGDVRVMAMDTLAREARLGSVAVDG